MELVKDIKDLFCSENIKKVDGSYYNIYWDGLCIYIIIDFDM